MPPLLVIVGETASGKSDLALRLARKYNGELVCADSWTVYKGFDIGTAKPTAEERRSVPHHLLDVADPAAGFSAAIFKRIAMEAVTDISQRGKLPIMVGGTGLYIDSVIYDYSFLPISDAGQRQELNGLQLSELLEKATEMRLDISGIDTRNKRRVIRLIENNGALPTRQPLRQNTLLIGLQRPTGELQQRIGRRIDAMVANGFPDEVRHLGERYGFDCEPMRAPGYRVFADYIHGSITMDMAKERFRQNDLQLAKKQRTWFKRNKSIHWFSAPVNYAHIDELVTSLLNNRYSTNAKGLLQ